MAMRSDPLNILDRTINSFPRLTSLLFGYILIIFLTITTLNQFLDRLQVDLFTQTIIFDAISIIWLLIWSYFRLKLPSNKKDKIGVIFSIITENNNQNIRYKNDLIKKVRKLAADKGLIDSIEIIVLSDFQAEKVSSALIDFSKEKRVQYNPTQSNKLDKSELLKINKKIKGHLYIWGSIKERTDIDEKYIIEIEALVFHTPIVETVRTTLENDISSVWLNQIMFQKNNEFVGFNISADLIFICAEYILGLAAYVSGDVKSALSLHKDCLEKINNIKEKPPRLIEMNNRLNQLIEEESLRRVITEYSQGDKDSARNLLNDILNSQPNSYNANIAKSVFDFNDGDIQGSYKAIIKAYKTYKSNGVGVHSYNKAFLLMALHKYNEAFILYQKISKSTYKNENYTLDEVGVFLRGIIKTHKDMVEAYFVLGYLEYKKNDNYPSAYTNFDTFIKKTNGKEQYNYLSVRAKTYLNELESKMKLSVE